MKKIFALLLAAALVFSLAACGSPEAAPEPEPAPAEEAPVDDEPEPDPEPVDVDEDPEPEEAGDGLALEDIRIALVTHSPPPASTLDDGSFNEGAWTAIQLFLTNHGLSSDQAASFQPNDADDEARIDIVTDAIEGFGANIVVLPGFHFGTSSYYIQNMFPDVYFIVLDASPTIIDADGNPGPGDIAANLVGVHYEEHEAGFLAGYAAVMEGYRELGFMGGIAVPAVVRFGHGYLQGAEYAAEELGLDAGEVTVQYYYLGAFSPSPEAMTMASAWFAGGIEVIFAAAGGANFSVIEGGDASGGSVIGVDFDQHDIGESVITSALKVFDVSVYTILTDILEGNFRGGISARFGAVEGGVGLPMETSRFQNFTQAQYDAIFDALVNGTVVVNDTLEISDLDFDLIVVDLLN